MASFKVPCPSCEHQVPIKSESLVGTKVECPKCKYRFKVEEPAGGAPGDGEKADKKKKAASPDGKKKSKKTTAIIVGVLAVAVLAVVGFAMMGGDKKKPTPGGPKGGGQVAGVPGTGGVDPGTGDPEEKKDPDKVNPPVKPKSSIAYSDKEASNLLPAQTAALYRFDLDRVRQTSLSVLFDRTMQEMLRGSTGLNADQVGLYYHAFVGDTRDPFGVIRLKEPVLEKDVMGALTAPSTTKTIKKWNLVAFQSNPFANGVSNALSFGALFGEFYDKVPPAPTSANRVIGMCVYDTQTVLIGDYARLEKFLMELNDKGYPKFLSSTEGITEGVALAEKPLYLSIDPKLKAAFRELGSESQSPPPIVYTEKYVPGSYDPKLIKSDWQSASTILEPLLNRAQFVGACLHVFDEQKLLATFRISMVSNDAAFSVVKDHLTPGLELIAHGAGLFLNLPVQFRNLTASGTPGTGGTGGTGGSGTIPGMGEGPGTGLTKPPGGMGGTSLGPPAGGTSLGPPAGGGGSSLGPPAGGSSLGPPAGGMGSAGGPPGGTGMPPGGTGFPPGGTGFPPGGTGFPPGGTGFPPGGMDPTGSGTPDPKMPTPSHIDLGLTDQNITITVEFNWTNEAYRQKIEPRLLGLANTVKGKMAIFTSDLSNHRLSAAVPAMTAALKGFPRGTSDRKLTDASRYGLKYKPETRVSFFAELLPFLAPQRVTVRNLINPDFAWFTLDTKNSIRNLEAAEAWVPELLVSSYPQSSWRATNWPDQPGRVFGGTNYVAIAGVGLNIARENPSEEKFKKKVGITGYDWGSKLEEVSDGLANTIYLMQTPPGVSQPWMVGGGATVRGLNETDPMRGFAHTFGTPGGKSGTIAIMGDGSVRFIPADIKKEVLLAMATRAGGEDISAVIDKEAPLIYSPHKKPEAEVKAEVKPVDPKPADPKKGSDTPVDPKAPAAKGELAPAPREKN